jgi:hypothetical protein
LGATSYFISRSTRAAPFFTCNESQSVYSGAANPVARIG